jgi:glycosyltransferase involved in cell wall biosynthesis
VRQKNCNGNKFLKTVRKIRLQNASSVNKALFFYRFGNGGAERVVLNLIEYTDNKPTIYTFKDVSEHRHLNVKTIGLLEAIKLVRTCGTLQVYLLKGLLFIAILKLIGIKFHAEAVHCFSYYGYLKNVRFKRAKKFIIYFSLKMFDKHIFKSSEMQEETLKFFKTSMDSKVIRNPNFYSIDTKNFENNLQSSKHIFCVVGRLEKSKNLIEFLRFVELMPREIEFKVLGSGSMHDEIKNLLLEKQLENVKLYGFIKDPREVMLGCTHYISFSSNEGFPNALVEALSCGLICIHNDCKTGPREIMGCDLELKIVSFFKAQRGLLFNYTAKNALDAYFYINNSEITIEHFSESIVNFLSTLNPYVAAGEYFEA